MQPLGYSLATTRNALHDYRAPLPLLARVMAGHTRLLCSQSFSGGIQRHQRQSRLAPPLRQKSVAPGTLPVLSRCGPIPALERAVECWAPKIRQEGRPWRSPCVTRIDGGFRARGEDHRAAGEMRSLHRQAVDAVCAGSCEASEPCSRRRRCRSGRSQAGGERDRSTS